MAGMSQDDMMNAMAEALGNMSPGGNIDPMAAAKLSAYMAEFGAGLETRNNSLSNPKAEQLIEACKSDNLNLVLEIHQTDPQLFQDDQSLDLHHVACEYGSFQVLEFFLTNFPNKMNVINVIGDNLVCTAAREGQLKILQMLIDNHGGNINSQTKTQMPAYALCFPPCENNTDEMRVEMLKYFVEKGCNFNVRSRDGSPGITFSITHGNYYCLKYLFSQENERRNELKFHLGEERERNILVRALGIRQHPPYSHLVAVEAIRKEEECSKNSGDIYNLLGTRPKQKHELIFPYRLILIHVSHLKNVIIVIKQLIKRTMISY